MGNRSFIPAALCLLSLLAPGCNQGSWLSASSVLVSGHDITNTDCRTGICRHNENTDMVVWKGDIYLVHRTAKSQILGPNSALHIYRSRDQGQTFTQLAVIPAPSPTDSPPDGRDLRDPHFYQVGADLHIKALTRLPVTSTFDSNVDTVAMETHSSDGATWSALSPIGPHGWSFWRIKQQAGVYYTAAYQDGDASVVLFSSTDGINWTQGASVWGVTDDHPVETELQFMPSGRLLALVRMDGTQEEELGSIGRLRTKICWAMAPYDHFDCPDEFDGQRLDGPLSFFHGSRLFVVARRHLGSDGRKRTSLFEITGQLEGGPLAIASHGDLPSAGDTAYAGVAEIDANRSLVSWYSSDLYSDETWLFGILDLSDIWLGTIDFSAL
jgi:hypothetical protein